VTGGAGFIGSHLCRRLLAAGHEVLIVDNYYSATRGNITDLAGEPRLEIIRHDVTFPLYVEVDQIYHQTRSFCYVDDLVDGLIRLMDTPHDVTGPINLGNPREVSMLELARKVIDLVGRDARIEFTPLPADDPVQRRPNIDKARELLGWKPTVELDEGLACTIDYFSRSSVSV
jgi:nucleoside-diphosphate-sugar epimerase